MFARGTGILLFVAATAAAQGPRIPRGGTGEPGYWVGLSYGYLDGTSMNDDATNSRWAFGYSSQIRATFEKTIQRGVAGWGWGGGVGAPPGHPKVTHPRAWRRGGAGGRTHRAP